MDHPDKIFISLMHVLFVSVKLLDMDFYHECSCTYEFR